MTSNIHYTLILFDDCKKRITSFLIYPSGRDLPRQFHNIIVVGAVQTAGRYRSSQEAAPTPAQTHPQSCLFTTVSLCYHTIHPIHFSLFPASCAILVAPEAKEFKNLEVNFQTVCHPRATLPNFWASNLLGTGSILPGHQLLGEMAKRNYSQERLHEAAFTGY